VKITKDKRRNKGGKANAVIGAEGSRPECAKASAGVTTGVEEQGMSSKGYPGNLDTLCQDPIYKWTYKIKGAVSVTVH
jgi:hypothetical protein